MKLEPLQNWVIGRTALTKKSKSIIVLNPTARITRFVLIEQVGADAEKAGYKAGDFVIPVKMFDMPLNDGDGNVLNLVTFPITEIICKASGLVLEDLIGVDEKPFVLKRAEVAA